MLSESRNMPGCFFSCRFRPRPKAAWCFLARWPAGQNRTRRTKVPELSTSPALQNQTTSR